MHPYAARVHAELQARSPWEKEFLQAVAEVFDGISPILASSPAYEGNAVLERMVEPERVVSFRVAWTDARGKPRVNRGHRVQFSSVLGPYKGGTRFHPSVELGSLKFLAFEQTFKNALTGLPLGSGKGGADFVRVGQTELDVMRFCQAYMTELYRHIGPNTDVPAGDVGVGAREIGYLFGQYRRLANAFDGTITGKSVGWGGSVLRPEATGFGVAYFTEEALRARGESLDGKRVVVSGFGNVAWGTVQKVTQLGGKVVTLSGPDGFVHDPDGVGGEKIAFMLEMRDSGRDEVREYAERFGVEFVKGKRPWGVPCDVALPCAIQNELDEEDAAALIANGCRCVVEGANMPSTPGAVHRLQAAGLLFAPGKAANAGGVATSGLEMAQNAAFERWDAARVDTTLRSIMVRIHGLCRDAAEQIGRPGDYVAGANAAAFLRVADAMMDQGVV